MISFSQFISEKILSFGLNKNHDIVNHIDDLHDIIHSSYKAIGGYRGIQSGSDEEKEAIKSDLSNSNHIVKAVKRNSKVVAAVVYKHENGNRKIIAAGTNSTLDGKKGLLHNILGDDHKMKRAWGEFSGPLKHVMHKMNFPVIPSEKVKELLPDKEVVPVSTSEYKRTISGKQFTKTAMGYVKNP